MEANPYPEIITDECSGQVLETDCADKSGDILCWACPSERKYWDEELFVVRPGAKFGDKAMALNDRGAL